MTEKRICILGGGNIGTLLLGDLGRNENIHISLLTSNPSQWNNEVEVYSFDGRIKYISKVDKISNVFKDVVSDADIIISTLPSHVFPEIINKAKPFIKIGTWIGVMPGSGGSEFYCKDIVEKGCTLFGFQRVSGIARVKEYGKSVYDLGKKSELHIAAIPSKKTEEVCSVMEELFNIKCHALPNYLNVTLTPSNPILHTTRLYSIFDNYHDGMSWDKIIDFYEDWTDESSKMLFECDEELQTICRIITGLDLTGVKSLKEHYESEPPELMTKKISNISAFRGIKTPMIRTDKGYIPDFKSRYFLEDFPYGLCIIKGFSNVVEVDTPAIDKVLMWFEKVAGVQYYVNEKFTGKDLTDLPLPQNYGLNTVEEIIKYYG